jgi:DNA uptake protein ComE-like DNA-binding protein
MVREKESRHSSLLTIHHSLFTVHSIRCIRVVNKYHSKCQEAVGDMLPEFDETQTRATPRPPAQPNPEAGARYARNLAAPVLVLLPLAWWVVLSSSDRVAVPTAGADGANAHSLVTKIDPNTAPWWELTALPRIGETTARKIVAYRDAYRARNGPGSIPFRTAHDLTQVKGIGPNTVQRIQSMLAFPAAPVTATAGKSAADAGPPWSDQSR